jgi:hypothetical protein
MSQLTSNRPLKFFEWEGDCFHCPELAHVVEIQPSKKYSYPLQKYL